MKPEWRPQQGRWRGEKGCVSYDVEREKQDPPPIPRPGALNTLGRVREELGQIYRDARQGKIQTQDLTRLAYTLSLLSKVIETETYETRMAAIEHALAVRGAR